LSMLPRSSFVWFIGRIKAMKFGHVSGIRSFGQIPADLEECNAEQSDEQPKEDTATAAEKIAVLQDKLLRALAEMENTRQRHSKELDSAKQYAVTNFAKSMLEVADNLSMATTHMGETIKDTDEEIKKLFEGVKMTESILGNVFERFGVVKFESVGKTFDPKYHEALFQLDDPSKPKGTITQVLQPGYMIHDRVLRAAKVGCSKGGS